MFKNINMEIKDIIMTAAVILGPIFAVQAQKLVESFREKRERRLKIFMTLMATRAERLHREHVQSLNMIDIEFYGRMIPFIKTRYQTKKEQAVTHSWKSYNNHLSQQNEYGSLENWGKKNDELFVQLLYSMAQALNYDYDKVQLQRDCYRPKAHGDYEQSQLRVLSGIENIVNGKSPLPTFVTNFNDSQTKNEGSESAEEIKS
ncbi:hypothetical protein DENIS_3707 [Desulfonema ishimotonii]|uniref:DUF6680 domain-containing protein n=1 Tax=Desulfonema ishimotonii TaxID=45657 RepID=A0A401G0I5_9BACT|nr:DUF6680 family protein [Desulfonema ishimotonii]GBC62730.1 hypothetical protein DENIS_3707 [Desulfonema ishimotonii]